MNQASTIIPFTAPEFLRRTLVLIPALNEEASLPATIADWRDLGAARVRVVDNGSTDRTAAAAREAGAEVMREPRRGYGAAVWRGLQDWPETMAWVLFSSADGSDRLTPAEAIRWQEAVANGADLVLGDRTARPSAETDLNTVQRLGNRLICRALRLGWGARFHDMGSLRLIRHRTLLSLGLRDRGFGWNVEMQIRALQRGLTLIELPVTYPSRRAGRSKISGSLTGTVRASWGIARMLVQMWRWRRQGGRGFLPEPGLPEPKPRPPV